MTSPIFYALAALAALVMAAALLMGYVGLAFLAWPLAGAAAALLMATVAADIVMSQRSTP